MGPIKERALSGQFVPKSQRAFVDAVLGDDRLLRALISLEEQVALDVPQWLRRGESGGVCVRVPPGYFESLVEDVTWLCSEGQASQPQQTEAQLQKKLEDCERRLAENTREYLRELTVSRERLAERTRFGEQEVLEEELYVYEPLRHFNKAQQDVMREVIDERVRQLLSRRPDDSRAQVGGLADGLDPLEELREELLIEQNKYKETKANLDAALKAKREAEKLVVSTKEDLKAAKNVAEEKTREAAALLQKYDHMEALRDELENELALLRGAGSSQGGHDLTSPRGRGGPHSPRGKPGAAAADSGGGTAAGGGAAAPGRGAGSQLKAGSARKSKKGEKDDDDLDNSSVDLRNELDKVRRQSRFESEAAVKQAIEECEEAFEVERVEFRKTIADLKGVVSALKFKLQKAEEELEEIKGGKSKKGKKKNVDFGLHSTQLSNRNVFLRLHSDAIEHMCRMEDMRGKANWDRELELWRTSLKQRKFDPEDSVEDSIGAETTSKRSFTSTIKKHAQLSIVSALEDDPDWNLDETVKAGIRLGSAMNSTWNTESSVSPETQVQRPTRRLLGLDDKHVVAQCPLQVHFPDSVATSLEEHPSKELKPLHAMSRPSSSPGLSGATQPLKRPSSSPGLTRMRPVAAPSQTKTKDKDPFGLRGRTTTEDGENLEQARQGTSILWTIPAGTGAPSNRSWRQNAS